jgi:type I restriction enzyme R subunit
MREKTNILRFRSLREKLEEIIEEYENNIISSSKIIERLIELAKEIKDAERAGEALGLSSEEMAFYDALSEGKKALKDEELKRVVKELVRMIKRDIAIDWTNHEVIKARIRTNSRLILLQHRIAFEEVDRLTDRIYEQAFFLYKDYQPR